MKDLTPREIVAELDRHIIGQRDAKRAVAIAVRNRWRRQQLPPDLAAEVMPKNIIMIGPTGVGKTEIARRLSKLVNAPFIKVEASKYTEVGYHGRDVESMIRDLLDLSINMVRAEHAEVVKAKAETAVDKRLVGLLFGDADDAPTEVPTPEPAYATAHVSGEDDHHPAIDAPPPPASVEAEQDRAAARQRSRERMLKKLRDGAFEDREIEITVRERQSVPVIGMMNPSEMDPGMAAMLEQIIPDRQRSKRVTVKQARRIFMEEETDKLVDEEKVIEQATERMEQSGIVFLDEIDKVAAGAGKASGRGGADVSREGVQRDLLPIVEGCAVNTRHGVVRTDQILFVAAGAFHVASVSDLMPELQGRFPIRVELSALTKDDFRRILTEPDASLTQQQQALLATEGIDVQYDEAGIEAMAELAAEANDRLENIGARRLMTVMECVFDEISFEAPDMVARGEVSVTVTEQFVRERVGAVLKDEDLSRFVL